jgi:hypothetical protein
VAVARSGNFFLNEQIFSSVQPIANTPRKTILERHNWSIQSLELEKLGKTLNNAWDIHS